MAGLVEKNYGNALFEAVTEDDPKLLEGVLSELSGVDAVIAENPELIKFSKTPTIEKSEKLAVIESAFKGRLSEYSYNFLMVLTEAGRLDYFGKIYRYFVSRCNDYLGIADITVVTTVPLSGDAREKLCARMSAVTGKKINLKEEINPSIIGGIVIKYGNRSFDGSVRARLDALKNEIGSVIC